MEWIAFVIKSFVRQQQQQDGHAERQIVGLPFTFLALFIAFLASSFVMFSAAWNPDRVTKKVPNISGLLISNKHLHAEWSSFEKKKILLRPRVRLITQGVPSRDLRISRRNNLITRLVFLVAHSAPSGEMVEEGEPFIRSPEAAREQSSPVR